MMKDQFAFVKSTPAPVVLLRLLKTVALEPNLIFKLVAFTTSENHLLSVAEFEMLQGITNLSPTE